MKDNKTLNEIFESVYEKKIPIKESFIHKYDRLNDKIRESSDYDFDEDDDISFKDFECDEITGDFVSLVLNEDFSKTEAIEMISKGWGATQEEIIQIINSTMGGYIGGYNQEPKENYDEQE